jgi:hypothetical protein
LSLRANAWRRFNLKDNVGFIFFAKDALLMGKNDRDAQNYYEGEFQDKTNQNRGHYSKVNEDRVVNDAEKIVGKKTKRFGKKRGK